MTTNDLRPVFFAIQYQLGSKQAHHSDHCTTETARYYRVATK